MRTILCAMSLLYPTTGWADDVPYTSTGRQQNRPVKFSGTAGTYYEGLVIALLGSCPSENAPGFATQERWDKALAGDHLRVSYPKPREFAMTSHTGEPERIEVDEILVPISAEKEPGHIYMRCGKDYRAFTKYEHEMVEFIRNDLKKLRR